MRLANPLFLLLLPVLGLAWWSGRRQPPPTLFFSTFSFFPGPTVSRRVFWDKIFSSARWLVLFLLVLALSRPQAEQITEDISSRGIDIMLVLDTSTSMQAIDFNPENRLGAAKKVARDFIRERKYDRVGIVVFGGLAYTQCPVTIDHDAVLNFLDQVEIGMTGIDGTAIGSAIATAVNRLSASPAKSKVIILLTDGRNNMGEIDPLTASQAAAALNIKIYTIGAGRPGGAIYPVADPFFGQRYVHLPEQELDESMLQKIASITGGRYFRAKDINSLIEIFRQIDALEKTEIKLPRYSHYRELYYLFLWPALLILVADFLVRHLWLRVIP